MAWDLNRNITDESVVARAATLCGQRGISLPTFAEIMSPASRPLPPASLSPDEAHPLNLYRVHWYNDAERRGRVDVPGYVEIPPEFSGVPARIAVLLGERFPLISAHKVLAAYACLVPRLITGAFDPQTHRALWPSTGNYCRGGVAISRILGCRGVAILPAEMSQERFDWLERWVIDPEDIIRTPGSESNVKEIYDACAELSANPANLVFNQFAELGNHIAHRTATAAALNHVARHLGAAPAAYVSASGSAGTLAAGDPLKDTHGTRIVAVEARECPTLSRSGFGSHNIQGIGDKHVPLIHNALHTDLVATVSDRATDDLFCLFQSEEGRRYLADRRGFSPGAIQALDSFGLSSIANILGSIAVARELDLGPDDLVLTIATDGAAMYRSELPRLLRRDFPSALDSVAAAEVWGRDILGVGTTEVFELSRRDRERIFNLGYFTWVEQRGVPLEDFEARRSQSFWRGLEGAVQDWDEMIRGFNERARG